MRLTSLTQYVLIGLLSTVSCKEQTKTSETNLTKLGGQVFGTSYSVLYESEVNYEKALDSIYYLLNKSLSTYQTNSDISKLNRNEKVEVDQHFVNVFKASKEIFHQTDGAFDPTIGAVVNAWDFGPEGKIIDIDSLKIDSLMVSVGLDKVKLVQNKINKPKNTYLDFNAIAKGYAVDVVAEFFESRNIENYLVEIGGEIRTKGVNTDKDSQWKAGIETPRFDEGREVLRAIALNNESIATSGTYRKFKVDDDGNRYSHIIDAKTGYPSKTNLLSVSVITETCMKADAYATAFKTMGVERIKSFLKFHPEIKVFLIFDNEDGDFETLSLNGFPD